MTKPNIIFIMSDDHAAHAISAYGSAINKTPNIDRIAAEGMRFDNCFCTNSICAPSRAVILTGKYNHLNGVRTLNDDMDNSQMNYAKLLQAEGYQTGISGKWHLGEKEENRPAGFDFWRVLPGQGLYHDPVFIDPDGKKVYKGYATDLITDFAIDWLDQRDRSRPFCLMIHHKAPHRPWEPDEAHANMYDDYDIPEPPTFNDDYDTRSACAKNTLMEVANHLNDRDLKADVPEGLTPEQEKSWKYQRYIKDYLRCIASVDDNVGRVIDYIDNEGIRENTIIIYTSDQGFFLGDHGWYDKRFMYEESLRMPFVISYPAKIKPGSVNTDMVVNIDFAPTFLQYAGVSIPEEIQGESMCGLLEGKTPPEWRKSMYYRYFQNAGHGVCPHYGIRTHTHKLICYYAPAYSEPAYGEKGKPGILPAFENINWPLWELYDLNADPAELNNIYDKPESKDVIDGLKSELYRLKEYYKDFE